MTVSKEANAKISKKIQTQGWNLKSIIWWKFLVEKIQRIQMAQMRDKTSRRMETPRDALSTIEQLVETQIADSFTATLSVLHSVNSEGVIKVANVQEDILQEYAISGGMEAVV